MDQYIKDITKGVVKKNYSQELPAGADRRYEPEIGIRKHNERIHKESKLAEAKNLPFNFRKPPKPLGRSVGIECPYCERYIGSNTNTVAIICSGCGKFFKVEESNE